MTGARRRQEAEPERVSAEFPRIDVAAPLEEDRGDRRGQRRPDRRGEDRDEDEKKGDPFGRLPFPVDVKAG